MGIWHWRSIPGRGKPFVSATKSTVCHIGVPWVANLWGADQDVTYTNKEMLVNIGPTDAETERQHAIPLLPIIGVTAVLGGIALLVVGARK